MSETVGIREAKARLGRLVQRAERGDSITFTYRGRPVARIVPSTDPDKNAAARLVDLKSRGWIQDHTEAPVTLPKLAVERGLAQRYLREERRGSVTCRLGSAVWQSAAFAPGRGPRRNSSPIAVSPPTSLTGMGYAEPASGP